MFDLENEGERRNLLRSTANVSLFIVDFFGIFLPGNILYSKLDSRIHTYIHTYTAKDVGHSWRQNLHYYADLPKEIEVEI